MCSNADLLSGTFFLFWCAGALVRWRTGGHELTTIREVFAEMLNSVDTPLNECIDILLDKMRLDPHFVEFYEWAGKNNVPIIVLSSGLIPIISALLEKLLGKLGPHLHIVANDAQSRDGKDLNEVGGWEVKYLDDR